MYGRSREDRRGQLALMDSMVFFVAALAICGALVSYAEPSAEPRMNLQGDTDPAEILPVLLRASIGRPILMNLEGGHYLDGTEDVAVCIAVELHALSSGASQNSFSLLNTIILEMMNSLCNPVLEPFLIIYCLDNGLTSSVLKLPCEEPESKNLYASSAEIPGEDGNPYRAILVLSPATLPESG